MTHLGQLRINLHKPIHPSTYIISYAFEPSPDFQALLDVQSVLGHDHESTDGPNRGYKSGSEHILITEYNDRVNLIKVLIQKSITLDIKSSRSDIENVYLEFQAISDRVYNVSATLRYKQSGVQHGPEEETNLQWAKRMGGQLVLGGGQFLHNAIKRQRGIGEEIHERREREQELRRQEREEEFRPVRRRRPPGPQLSPSSGSDLFDKCRDIYPLIKNLDADNVQKGIRDLILPPVTVTDDKIRYNGELYTIGKEIGSGSYGTVSFVKRGEDEESRFVSKSNFDPNEEEGFKTEVIIQTALTCELRKQIHLFRSEIMHEGYVANISRLHFVGSTHSQHIIVMKAGGITLNEWFLNRSYKEIRPVLKSVFGLLKNLQASMKFMHRDLHCLNILVGPSKEINIVDFGFSRVTVEGGVTIQDEDNDVIEDFSFHDAFDVYRLFFDLWSRYYTTEMDDMKRRLIKNLLDNDSTSHVSLDFAPNPTIPNPNLREIFMVHRFFVVYAESLIKTLGPLKGTCSAAKIYELL